MPNQNVVWVVQQSASRKGPWINTSAYDSRDTAREYAKEAVANYTRVRKYIDSGDKT